MARKPSTQLQDLVCTLTPNEQGYIRKVLKNPLARSSGEMYELFDAAIQNNSKIVNKAPSQIKRNLLDKILQILRYISADESSESVVMGLIEESKILQSRSLISAAQQRLFSALEICDTHSNFALQANVLGRMAELEQVTRGNFYQTRVVEYEQKRTECLRNEYVLAQLQEITRVALQQLNEYNFEIDFLELEQKVRELGINSEQHVKLQLYYLRLLTVVQHAQSKHDELSKTTSATIEIFKNNPQLLADPIALIMLNNMFTTSVHNKELDVAKQAFDLLNNLRAVDKFSENELWYVRQRAHIVYLLLQHNYADILLLKKSVADGAILYSVRGQLVEYMWTFASATAYLMLEKYPQGLQQVQKLFHAGMHDKGSFIPAKLLEVMLYISNGDFTAAQYRVRSIERSDAKVLAERPVAKRFLTTLKHIANQKKSVHKEVTTMLQILQQPIELPAERMLVVSLQMEEFLKKKIIPN